MRKKRLLFFISCLLMTVFGLGIGGICIFAEKTAAVEQLRKVSVFIRGLQVDFADQSPEIIENRVMIPLRAVFEHQYVQCAVKWDEVNQTVIAVDRTGRCLIFKIGENDFQMMLNGQRFNKRTDVAPVIKNGRTLLPLRALGEALDFGVNWIDSESKVGLSEKADKSGSDRMLMSAEEWEHYLHPAPDSCAPSG